MAKLNEAETLWQLEEAERHYWDKVDRILAKRVQPLVEAYCRKYSRKFWCGNGDWHLDNPAIDHKVTSWRRGERVAFGGLQQLLDSPVSRMNCIGSLLENYEPPNTGTGGTT